MNVSEQIAKHFKEVFFGGNWTSSNLKGQLSDITWQEATTEVYGLNSIATLTYHIVYFIRAQLRVLQGGPLEGKDSLSFDHPTIDCQEDWDSMQQGIWRSVEVFAEEIKKFPESRLGDIFCKERYGIYYRNLHGIIEHTHYHLGQIALVKKILREKMNSSQMSV